MPLCSHRRLRESCSRPTLRPRDCHHSEQSSHDRLALSQTHRAHRAAVDRRSALNPSASWFGLATVSPLGVPTLWVSRGWSAADSCDDPPGLPVGKGCHTLHTLLDSGLHDPVLVRWSPHYPARGDTEPYAGNEAGG